jgi:hypothetical protein
MAGAEQDAGFLSRWSRRKAEARGPAVPEVAAPVETAAESAVPTDSMPTPGGEVVPAAASAPIAAPPPESIDANPEPPPLTLADVAQLTRDSNFSRFIAADVQADVKNAALKKLFSDPHFNVMDGLDVYIGDYNTPDPLPPGMLMKMVQAQFLGLVKQGAEELLADRPTPMNHGTIEVEPESAGTDPLPEAPPADKIATHEDADLQLQPHDAAGRVDVDPGPGENGGREH